MNIETINLVNGREVITGLFRPGSTVLVLCDCTGGAITPTLPDARTINGNKIIICKTDDSVNAVTGSTTASQTISGAASVTISSQYDSVCLYSDGSNYLKVSAALLHTHTRCVAISIVDSDDSVTVADGVIGFLVPVDLNGYNLTDVIAGVHTKGVTGTTDIQVRRRRAGTDADMLSTKVTIGDEFYANDETIDTDKDDVATGDMIFIDVDAIHSGTASLGLSVTLTFTK